MPQTEQDYAPAVEMLRPVLHNLPSKIVAIGGLPGVGKTTLGRYLAYSFNVSLIETDLFLIPKQSVMIYREDWISQVISSRLDRADPERRRPVIIEGSTILRLLASLGRKPDFFIQVFNDDAPESSGALAYDLARYEAEFAPAKRAHLCLTFSA
ncbi:hypothetical protein [Pararhizobium sp.]|uniref:hypothetical protein n=1 Tax=Pararhizobium sp. TaxID=1977563 RepID=UPI003D14DF1C